MCVESFLIPFEKQFLQSSGYGNVNDSLYVLHMPESVDACWNGMRTNCIPKTILPCNGKNAPISTECPSFGQRGPYCLDLGAVATAPTTVSKTPEMTTVVASTSLVMLLLIAKDVAKKVEKKRPTKYRWTSSLLSISHYRGPQNFKLQNRSSSRNARKTSYIKPMEWDGDIYMHLARSCDNRPRVDSFRHIFRRHPFVLYLVCPRVITLRCSQLWRTRYGRMKRLKIQCREPSSKLHP